MIYNLKVGDPIPLSQQLFNYDPALFVKVYAYDKDHSPVPGSPVELGAIGSLGLYTDTTLVMPDSPYAVAQYAVYDDSGYTTLSTSQGASLDTFVRNELVVGGPLPLYAQLWDYDASKYVKAFLTKLSTNTAPPGSPVILSPIGSLGLYGNNQFLVPNTRSLVAQYIVYDTSAYSTPSTSEGGSSDTFLIPSATMLMMAGNLPNMSDVLSDWMQPLVFMKVVKSVPNFQVREQVPNEIRCMGVWQPQRAQDLVIKPPGQRQWKWFMLHTKTCLPLNPDDVVSYLTVNYRVMSKWDWSPYGYYQYELVEDYYGPGVTPT